MTKHKKHNDQPYAVKVKWHDAHDIYPEWTLLGTPMVDDQARLVETVGWLIPNVKKGHLVVALNKTNDDHVANGISIPEDMVVKVVKL